LETNYQDDIVLISLRSFQDDRSDIVMKYFPEEVKQLQAMGELPYELELEKKDTGNDGGL